MFSGEPHRHAVQVLIVRGELGVSGKAAIVDCSVVDAVFFDSFFDDTWSEPLSYASGPHSSYARGRQTWFDVLGEFPRYIYDVVLGEGISLFFPPFRIRNCRKLISERM